MKSSVKAFVLMLQEAVELQVNCLAHRCRAGSVSMEARLMRTVPWSVVRQAACENSRHRVFRVSPLTCLELDRALLVHIQGGERRTRVSSQMLRRHEASGQQSQWRHRFN